MTRNTLESIMARLEPITESGCFIWTGGETDKGYGTVYYNGRPWRVHRLLYELLVGPIPNGKVSDHRCRVPQCANVHHLDIVTNYENVMRGNCFSAKNARKTHCIHGHPLSGDNLLPAKTSNRARRVCRICHERTAAEYNERRKMERRCEAEAKELEA